MKRIPYTIDAVMERVEMAEKNNRAFLLRKSDVESTVSRYQQNFGFLPKRLQEATIVISSGEQLPNAYKSYHVNNTIVTLSVHKGVIFLHTVERCEVSKNWFPTEINFDSAMIPEIKDKLFERHT